MRREFSIDQVSAMTIWLENGKKNQISISHISYLNVSDLNRKQYLTYKIVEIYFRNNISSLTLVMITG